MTALFLIGFLAFIFSLIYLLFHFIRKIKDKERTLSRKVFFPLFIGGLLLLIIGGSFMDTGLQEQLDEALAANTKLTTENKEIKTELSDLLEKNEKLIEENEKLNKDLKETSNKIADAEKVNKENETLSKEIANLKSENETLKSKIDSLNSQLASASSSTSDSSTDNDNSQETVSTSVKEVFQNCTDLRGTYPNGVPAGHPAYVPSMDRDKDNYACER